MNPDSNFRKFYLNDKKFYMKVIEKEEPPFEFKIHLFPKVDQMQMEQALGEDTELQMLQMLD